MLPRGECYSKSRFPWTHILWHIYCIHTCSHRQYIQHRNKSLYSTNIEVIWWGMSRWRAWLPDTVRSCGSWILFLTPPSDHLQNTGTFCSIYTDIEETRRKKCFCSRSMTQTHSGSSDSKTPTHTHTPHFVTHTHILEANECHFYEGDIHDPEIQPGQTVRPNIFFFSAFSLCPSSKGHQGQWSDTSTVTRSWDNHRTAICSAHFYIGVLYAVCVTMWCCDCTNIVI